MADSVRGPDGSDSSEGLGGMVPARLAAKSLDWEQDEENQWSEKNPVRWGFYIVLENEDELEPPEYRAYWGESDGETCATLDEAKAWCQKTADNFIADAALVTHNE